MILSIRRSSKGGSLAITIHGLPAGITRGTVYGESRSVHVAAGAFRDRFPQWGVHVYRFTAP